MTVENNIAKAARQRLSVSVILFSFLSFRASQIMKCVNVMKVCQRQRFQASVQAKIRNRFKHLWFLMRKYHIYEVKMNFPIQQHVI